MKQTVLRILLFLLILSTLPAAALAAEYLVPGGQVIGLELRDGNVLVAAFDEALGGPAREAGLRIGDRLVTIDGNPIHTAEDVRQALLRSDPRVTLTVSRAGKQAVLSLAPAITEEGPKLGVYLRQGATGIGTVTWYDPQTGKFGALGHGVSNSRGDLLQLSDGSMFPARIASIRLGRSGSPGQLRGLLDGSRLLGSVSDNTVCGVFGRSRICLGREPMEVAARQELHPGPARIRSTISDDGPREYSVEILKVYAHSPSDTRNMLLKITDPALLEATGGIVQGMSGSPIIQDGKLVGAVTHVLVNDPTTGYGIFIGNMLDAAG